jgi:hypothetical protein
MEVRFLAVCVITLLSALVSSGCSIRIPDGVIDCSKDADCPRDFHCRARGELRRCVRASTPAADGGKPLDTGVAPAADSGEPLDTGVAPAADSGGALPPADGGSPLGEVSVAAPPTFHGFTTSGATALDGFEKGGRVCTTNGRYCVTGAFEP